MKISEQQQIAQGMLFSYENGYQVQTWQQKYNWYISKGSMFKIWLFSLAPWTLPTILSILYIFNDSGIKGSQIGVPDLAKFAH